MRFFWQLILATLVAAKPSAGAQEDASAIPVLAEAAFRSLAVALGALGAGRQTGLCFYPHFYLPPLFALNNISRNTSM